MKLLHCIFVWLPLLAVPAYARILSERPRDKLPLVITIYNYARKTPSPPSPPSVSPAPHHAIHGANGLAASKTISRNSTASPPPPKASPTPTQRNRAPPPPPKGSPTPTQRTRAPPPPPKGSPTPIQKTRAPPPPPQGSPTPIQKTRAPPPPPKVSPSHGELGWSSTTTTDTSTTPFNILMISIDCSSKLPTPTSSVSTKQVVIGSY